jgi:hypothetical protein
MATVDRQERQLARELLEELMPQARERADELIGDVTLIRAESQIGETTLPWCRIENVWGVRLYPAQFGGWHADILLQGVPEGLPDALGTPASNPAPTRGEALIIAVELVAMAIAKSRREPAPEKPKHLIFDFHDFEIRIPVEVYDQVRPLALADPRTREMMLERLAEITEEVFGSGVTETAMNALSEEARNRLMMVVLLSLAKNIFRYPVRADEPLKRSSTLH